MRIHYLQHVPFETPGAIERWAVLNGCKLIGSHLYRGEALPPLKSFDMLLVLGGPMSVNDENQYNWLAAEKRLVRDAVDSGRSVLGICLGAQMIADALGAPVYQATEKEIGWFPVRRSTANGAGALLPEEFTPLHWHGETFDLPPGATRLAQTLPVPNQAFQLGRRVVGLQFHLEVTPDGTRLLIENAGHEIETGGRFQQEGTSIVNQSEYASEKVLPLLDRVLSYLTC